MLAYDIANLLNSQVVQTPPRDLGGELDKEAFLLLLVQQLGNQDPLDPMTNEEFVSQLALFGSLEQEMNLNASFEQFNYKGIPLIWDRQCKDNSMYFINTDYLYWVTNEDSEFDLTSWKEAPNNLEKVAQAVLMGNMATSNRRMNGVLFDIGEAS